MLNEVKHLMKKYITIFLFLFLMPVMASSRPLSEVPDSIRISALDKKLNEYFKAIEREDFDVQKEECDFIIDSTKDSVLRQIIAEKVYDHYLDSRRMGAEGVAIHLFDKWFASGRLSMSDQVKSLNARIFADFNRQSLLGCKAPQLRMQTMQGDSLTVFPSSDRRYKVLYFYDTDCARCKVQTILLRNLLDSGNYPVDFYAIYVGDKKPEWEKYAADHLSLSADKTLSFHLWDAQLESDFQRKYGVMQTPRLFLVGPDGVIIGRGLDAAALAVLLEDLFSEKPLVYGSKASAKMFDALFDKMRPGPKAKDVMDVADHIASSTLGKADTLMFRQMTGDLLYYLSEQFDGCYKEGLYHLVKEYVLSKPDVWRTQDDSLKVIGLAEMMDDLLSKAAPGSRIPSIKVPGVLKTWKKEKHKTISLDKLGRKKNIIMFYSPMCSSCLEEKAAADKILAEDRRRTAVFLVDMDNMYKEHPQLEEQLLELFDLSLIPNIYITDKSGRILERYASLL